MVNFSTPHLDTESLLEFDKLLSNSKCLLEYGSGNSTIYALRKYDNLNIYTVESDPEYVSKLESDDRLNIIYVDIGKTKEWGWPVEFNSNYPRYSTSVWLRLKEDNVSPDLIFIDGRFRVACFLVSLIYANTGTIILFDDYYDRDYYWIVEKFVTTPPVRIGRMAKFNIDKPLELNLSLITTICEYFHNPS